jgi:hypothetical protein
MKKIITIATILFSGLFLFNSCQKNIDIFVPNPGQTAGPDSNWYSTINNTMPIRALQAALVAAPAKDSFESSSNTFTTVNIAGMQIKFSPQCCTNGSGQVITGKIYIEARLVKSKGDMILLNKPTSSNNEMLASGGEIFLSLSGANGQPLQITPGRTISIKYADSNPDGRMQLFTGDETNAERFNWIPVSDTFNTVTPVSQAYEVITNRLRWINVDYFYDTLSTSARSTISTNLPANYTNANTSVFVAFKDIRAVLRLTPDVLQKTFLSGKVPNNKVVSIVAISRQGDDYYLGKEIITTGTNLSPNNNQRVTLTPTKSSLADIKAYLATL